MELIFLRDQILNIPLMEPSDRPSDRRVNMDRTEDLSRLLTIHSYYFEGLIYGTQSDK